MVEINNGAVLRVAVSGTYSTTAEEIVNVYQLSLQSGGGLDFADYLDGLIEWAEALVEILKALQISVMLWRGISVQTLDSNVVSGFLPFDAPIAGTATGDGTPSGVAAFAYFNTGFSRKQARKYWGPIAESMTQTAGSLNTAGVDIVQDAVDYLMVNQSYGGATWRYCLAQPGGTTFFPIAATVALEPAYQRRRRR